MDNKLKELTDKLYGEGLEKGRAEAERLVADAEAKAAKIVAEAEEKAAQIVRKAEEKAADVEKNSITEIALAGKQAVAKIKNEIADLVIAKSTDEALKGAALDADFIKSMLLEVAKNWNGAGSKTELKALLPEAAEKEFAARFGASAGELLAAGYRGGLLEGRAQRFQNRREERRILHLVHRREFRRSDARISARKSFTNAV